MTGPATAAGCSVPDGRAPAGAGEIGQAAATALAGGDPARWPGKLPVRDRLAILLDSGSWVEDGLLANSLAGGLPADGVLTGTGTVEGRPVAVIAHDFTVKAGSWGELTCEKQIRILERADRDLLPVFYLVDSAGGRLTDQMGFFPGARGASRIFHLQVALSGRVPQICCLHGPSAAGGAYMPAFTDWVGMVEGNASMYLASPRVAEKVTGEKTTLEEMGGALMHATVSGCGDEVFGSDWEAVAAARLLFSYLPSSWSALPPAAQAREPEQASWDGIIPADPQTGYDVRAVIDRLADAGSFFEIKARWAREIVTGLARLGGRVVGLIANQPQVRGGAIFVDSADKAARFISWCDAFSIPLVFLQDVPGFMVINAYGQTETGSTWTYPIYGVDDLKAGSAGQAVPGHTFAVLDDDGRPVPPGTKGNLVITRPLPTLARTVWGDHERYRSTYFSRFPGCYATHDEAVVDADGHLWVLGRADDVINVAAHRISTMEIEAVVGSHPEVVEAAVVGVPDPTKGTVPVAFVTTHSGADAAQVGEEVKRQVTEQLGGYAQLGNVYVTAAMPKTRTGKTMRRVLRDVVVHGGPQGDVSVMEDPSALDVVIGVVREAGA